MTETIDRRQDDTDVDFVPVSPPSPNARRIVTIGVWVLVIVGILAGSVTVWAMRQIDPPGGQGEQIAVTVPAGAGVEEIAEILESEGVISDSTVFGWYTRLRGVGGNWKAGEYATFHRHSSMAEAVKVLNQGPVPPQATVLTVPPGARLEDTLNAITKAFPDITLEELTLALASGRVTSPYLPKGATSWEGLLAPDTYFFAKSATPEKVLQQLADQQTKVLNRLGYDRAEAVAGRSAYDLIRIASLVEREAGAPPEERGKIARVIDNRLTANEPLGIDAALLYGLGRKSGSLTQADLETDSPYNTRLRRGLPPTPIAMPGEASLAAAIQPTEGPWFYYVLVSNDPPSHLFTDSAAEFERAKEKAKAEGVF